MAPLGTQSWNRYTKYWHYSTLNPKLQAAEKLGDVRFNWLESTKAFESTRLSVDKAWFKLITLVFGGGTLA